MNRIRYNKQPGDEKYRKVSLMSSKEPEFQDFDSDTITYSEQIVLEILHSDGDTVLEYGEAPIQIIVNRNNDKIFFDKDVPTARVWLRPVENKNGIYYKVPNNLKVDTNFQWLYIPAGVQGYELCGDKYFEKVFSFVMKN